jgi:hypothetical protein
MDPGEMKTDAGFMAPFIKRKGEIIDREIPWFEVPILSVFARDRAVGSS